MRSPLFLLARNAGALTFSGRSGFKYGIAQLSLHDKWLDKWFSERQGLNCRRRANKCGHYSGKGLETGKVGRLFKISDWPLAFGFWSLDIGLGGRYKTKDQKPKTIGNLKSSILNSLRVPALYRGLIFAVCH